KAPARTPEPSAFSPDALAGKSFPAWGGGGGGGGGARGGRGGGVGAGVYRPGTRFPHSAVL
ncbi:hypothetical protein ABMZ20_25635, partial [Pseudomonas aeruginosa]|uniref:hypothetical protein n=1 Tax=Pseudomonas aeruginosa TaxID=287 RepID=UPI0039BDC142